MIGKITTPGVTKIPRITPNAPSQFAHATNQKISCSTPATATISVPSGRSIDLMCLVDQVGVLESELWGRVQNRDFSFCELGELGESCHDLIEFRWF